MKKTMWMGTVLGLLLCGPVWAGEVAYVDWTRAESDDLKHSGYAAFDGDESTAWCSGPDGVGDVLTLGFIGTQKVDEIGVIVGLLAKGELDKNSSRLRELEVSDGKTKQILVFKDKPTVQSIKIQPAQDSQRMTFSVANVFAGERRSSPVCITEIVLRHKGRALTGDVLKANIRGLNSTRQPLVHLWVDQPGAPERYLTLGMDGTFLWVHAPILEGKRVRLQGTWSASANKITFKASSGKSGTVTYRMDRVADGDNVFSQLVLEGEGLHEAFAATYQTTSKR
ncbi:MAG: hypothetical protein ABIJ09_18770 [Pseudomonadota bacterium]